MNQQDFGLRLKELRLSHAYTQSQLANMIGISRQAYMTYESGRSMPSINIISKLSNVFDADFSEIFTKQTTTAFSQSKDIITKTNSNNIFSVLELYNSLSPLSQKRIVALMEILHKGGDRR